MGRTANEYKLLLKSLLPHGRAWSRDNDSWLVQLLYGLGEEFARVETRTEDLLKEPFTLETTECITEHETDFGVEASGTIEDRRTVINAKKIAVGQQYKEYFIEIATALGWTVYIEEFTPAWMGLATVGCEANDQTALFYWKVWISPDGDAGGFSAGFNPEGFNSHYLNDRVWMDTVTPYVYITYLIEELTRLKPAHTHPLFDFYGRGFSRGFGWGSSPIPWYDDVCYPGGFNTGFGDGFANLRTYDGDYLIGGYSHGFNLGFNVYRGGGFSRGFSIKNPGFQGFSRMQ